MNGVIALNSSFLTVLILFRYYYQVFSILSMEFLNEFIHQFLLAKKNDQFL